MLTVPDFLMCCALLCGHVSGARRLLAMRINVGRVPRELSKQFVHWMIRTQHRCERS